MTRWVTQSLHTGLMLLLVLLGACSEGQPILEYNDPPPPALAISLSAANRSALVPFGSTEATLDSVALLATGKGAAAVAWRATVRRPWLRLLDTAGVGAGVIRWRRLGPGFPLGAYVDTIVVEVAGAIGSPAAVIDSLVVVPPPAGTLTLDVGPSSRLVTATVGGTPVWDSATVTIAGALAGSTPWYAAKRRLTTHLRSADGVGSGTLRWTRSPNGVSPGTYVDTIAVYAGPFARTIVDTFVVRAPVAPPSIRLEPNTRRDSVAPGHTGVRTDSVSVVVGGAVLDREWTATSRRAATVLLDRTGRGTQWLRFQRLPAGLPVGLYVDTIDVAFTDLTSLSARLIDTLKVGPIAEPLAVRLLSAGAHNRTSTLGAAAIYLDSVLVNLGGGGSATAPWTATARGASTTLINSSGAGSGWLHWRRSTAALPLGIHVDTLRVTVPGALGSPAELTDTVVVINPARPVRLAVNPSSRRREVVVGSGAAIADSARVMLTGDGASDVAWSAGSAKPWTQLVEFNGIGDGSVRWLRRPAGLIVGTYVDTMVVSAPGALDSPARIIDTLVVLDGGGPPPGPTPITLTVSPRSVRDSVLQGTDSALAQVNVALAGTGADTATWSASSQRSWTMLRTGSGRGTGILRWTRNTASLPAGLYIDSLRVGVAGASGSPALVVDTLLVAARPDTTTPGVGEANSPTGRNPRLIWTKQRQWVWNRMRSENHPWYQLIKSNGDKTGTAGERYGDNGQWATLMYQITGEVGYARKAFAKVRPLLQQPLNGNFVRDILVEAAWIYDWIYPGLSPAERSELIDGLNRVARWATGLDAAGGLRVEDSDEVLGYYFGLAFVSLATGPENALASQWLTGNIVKPAVVPIGGLSATGVNRATIRNTISDYIRIGAGGEWIESGQYNSETLAYLFMGIEGIRTATGVDHFPEARAYSRDVAGVLTAHVTTDLAQKVQWGDEEHPRDFRGRLFRHIVALGMAAGLNQDNVEGQAAQGLVLDLVAKYGPTGWQSAEPWSRIFLVYNPYAPRAAWATSGSYRYASGLGHLLVRNGPSLFSAFANAKTDADHETTTVGDFQLYRNGEWAVTRPLGYGAFPASAAAANSVTIAGLSAMDDRGPVREQHGAGWWSLTTRSQGSYYGSGYYDPPPTFVTRWQRSIVYFQEGGADVIVTWDSIASKNPLTLTKLDRYRPGDRAKITSSGGLPNWYLHPRTRPTWTGNRADWTTAGGQRVVLHALAPTDAVRSWFDEATEWAGQMEPYEITAAEKAYGIRIKPPAHRDAEVFLNVVVVGDPSLVPVPVPGGARIGATTVTFGAAGVTVAR